VQRQQVKHCSSPRKVFPLRETSCLLGSVSLIIVIYHISHHALLSSLFFRYSSSMVHHPTQVFLCFTLHSLVNRLSRAMVIKESESERPHRKE